MRDVWWSIEMSVMLLTLTYDRNRNKNFYFERLHVKFKTENKVLFQRKFKDINRSS